MITQYIVSGLTAGSLYALIALGFVLIYKSTGIVNFAQGELLMVGAYFALFYTSLGLPFYLVFIFVFFSAFFIGMVINNTICRPLIHEHHLNVVIATFALSFFMRSIIRLIFGSNYYSYPSPFPDVTYTLGNVIISANNLFIAIISILMMIVFYIVFQHTKIGKSLSATAQNQEAASLMGINVNESFTLIWGVSAGLAATSGMLFAPISAISPYMGGVGMKAFSAAVLGGFSSLPGSVLGGFLLGIIENLSIIYISSSYKDIIAFLLLVFVLILRPNGLLGKETIDRV